MQTINAEENRTVTETEGEETAVSPSPRRNRWEPITTVILLLILLVITALVSLRVRDLLSATMIFGVYSFLMCLLWAEMGAVDVAFTEATVGAGVSTVLFIGAILHTSRRSKD